MSEKNFSANSCDLVKMEYEKLQEYYLWSLSTHSERLDLYLKLLSATFAASFALAFSPVPQRYMICTGLAAAFLVVGSLLLERIITAQVTNTWCIFRLNMVRAFIREMSGLDTVFRPIPLRGWRKKGDLFGLLKYRMKSAGLVIAGNTIAAAGVVTFLFIRSSSILVVPLIAVSAGIAWLVQVHYFNRRYLEIRDFLVYTAKEQADEVQWMKRAAAEASATSHAGVREAKPCAMQCESPKDTEGQQDPAKHPGDPT